MFKIIDLLTLYRSIIFDLVTYPLLNRKNSGPISARMSLMHFLSRPIQRPIITNALLIGRLGVTYALLLNSDQSVRFSYTLLIGRRDVTYALLNSDQSVRF